MIIEFIDKGGFLSSLFLSVGCVLVAVQATAYVCRSLRYQYVGNCFTTDGTNFPHTLCR
jgi:hypothetical protein